jgi:polyisoprenoid-binding protein YceI
MNSIKTTLAAFLLLSLTTLNGAFAASKYMVDSNNSVVNFSTIKKQYVVEPAVFEGVTGSISNSGKVEINIDLSSVNTNISIRDQRLKALFFKVVKFPQASVKATIDMKKIKSIRHYKRMEIPAILEFYGISKEIKLEVLIAKVYKNKLLITSMKPIIINAKDYGIPAKNLMVLSKTVGGLSLSDKVAVNFVLSFAHK